MQAYLLGICVLYTLPKSSGKVIHGFWLFSFLFFFFWIAALILKHHQSLDQTSYICRSQRGMYGQFCFVFSLSHNIYHKVQETKMAVLENDISRSGIMLLIMGRVWLLITGLSKFHICCKSHQSGEHSTAEPSCFGRAVTYGIVCTTDRHGRPCRRASGKYNFNELRVGYLSTYV